MIKKRETCLYCGEKMDSKSAKKKFCSPIHKLYWHREKERGTLEPHQMEEAKLKVKSASIKKVEGKSVGVFEVDMEEVETKLSYNEYLTVIAKAESIEECQRLSNEIQKSYLKDWEKAVLVKKCIERSQHPDLN